MRKAVIRWLGTTLVVGAAAALLAACGDDTPTGPSSPTANLNLTGCENLTAPTSAALSLHVFAKGVQIYRWSGTAWTFVEPSAALFTDAEGKDAVGIHYAGPAC